MGKLSDAVLREAIVNAFHRIPRGMTKDELVMSVNYRNGVDWQDRILSAVEAMISDGTLVVKQGTTPAPEYILAPGECPRG